MDPFFLPLPLVRPAAGTGDNYHTIQQLEEYLDVALCLLRQTAERLRTTVGPEALGPQLNRFLEGNDLVAQSELVSRLDSFIKQKNQTEAVRLFRELLLVTWDQAFDLYSSWPHWDQTKKMRCLQTAELRRLFAEITDLDQQGSAVGLYSAARARFSQV